ncbi:MAG: galactose-1-phosphate uridylyltransferase, partial [Candidatus Omnitrophica bacterium]|nr:galactose-1-phosphate uridylyltransferase [Candidatus Omnitrophota bacterium]
MPQLRKDPIIGRWVIISTERGKRPHDFVVQKDDFVKDDCPFCEGQESKTPPEIFAIREPNTSPNAPGWSLRVVPNIQPLMQIEGEMGRRGQGMFDLMNGIGAHEVIIETNKHIANITELDVESVARVFDTYVMRMKDLEKDSRIKYALIFKNYGVIAGASPIRHSRSQLIALPVNPKRVKEELVGCKRYYEYKERCLFCDMIRHEIAAQARVIAHRDGFIAFAPYASRFPFEVWVLPEEHSCDFPTLKNTKGLASIMKTVIGKLSAGLNDPPYNYI